jgi:predicted transcriptional regulator
LISVYKWLDTNLKTGPKIGVRSKIELERLEPKYQVIRQVIELRKMLDLSQQELAKRINDRQSNIARLENGNANPSIEKLTQIAEGLNAELEIRLIPRP